MEERNQYTAGFKTIVVLEVRSMMGKTKKSP